MTGHKRSGLNDHPVVVAIVVIAALATTVPFLTGRASLPAFFRSESPATREGPKDENDRTPEDVGQETPQTNDTVRGSDSAREIPPARDSSGSGPPVESVEPAPDSTSEQAASTSRPSLASELTVAAHTKEGQRYPLHVRLAELSTTAISTKAKISLTNMSPNVLYYKLYYYHEIGGGISASDRFSLIGADGVSQEWREVDGVQEASPMTYFKNACLLLPPSVEVSITLGYEKQSPPGRVVVVHTPVRLSQWAPCPGTEIELPEFTLASALTS